MPMPGDPAEDETKRASTGDKVGRDIPEVREGVDAEDEARLRADPSDEDAKLDVGLDETFPTSDPPAATQPGSDRPAPSTGFDAEEERRLADERGR